MMARHFVIMLIIYIGDISDARCRNGTTTSIDGCISICGDDDFIVYSLLTRHLPMYKAVT